MLRKKVFRKNGNLINYIFNTAQHVICCVRDGWSVDEISSELFGVKFQWNFSPKPWNAINANFTAVDAIINHGFQVPYASSGRQHYYKSIKSAFQWPINTWLVIWCAR